MCARLTSAECESWSAGGPTRLIELCAIISNDSGSQLEPSRLRKKRGAGMVERGREGEFTYLDAVVVVVVVSPVLQPELIALVVIDIIARPSS